MSNGACCSLWNSKGEKDFKVFKWTNGKTNNLLQKLENIYF